MPTCKIFGIDRHRLATDGKGVTTLVVMHGCPLKCKYCLNPQCHRNPDLFISYEPEDLYEITKIDNLYFLATEGGVTFGGGEPAIQVDFIEKFRQIAEPQWKINIETSLCVPSDNVKRLLPIIDAWFIDIKDMNPNIYQAYTDVNNDQVVSNLKMIAEAGLQNKCIIRLPLIKDYNNLDDVAASKIQLENLGFDNFDIFHYKTPTK